MSEILRDENGHIIKSEQLAQPREVPLDSDFIDDLGTKFFKKYDKKTRESREFIKAQELESAQKSVENLQNVSYETNSNLTKSIIGVGLLILVGICGYKVFKNVKESQ